MDGIRALTSTGLFAPLGAMRRQRGWLSLLIEYMLDNLWLKIFSSPIQDLNCLASYSFSPVTNDKTQKLGHLQPDGLVCLTAKAVTEGAHQSEGEVLAVLTAMDAPMLLLQVVPHPGALGFPAPGKVAQVVIKVLQDSCVYGSRGFPMVNSIFYFL